MDQTTLEKIITHSESLKEWSRQFTHKRYLFEEVIATGTDFYVGIRGIRGIGKTTLLLQIANDTKNSVYFSADWTYLRQYSVYDIADSLRKRGFKTIFIDEIHTRPKWKRDLKTLYDEHQIRVFFSGSSSLGLKKTGADLSRRAIIYDLQPASFREYLNLRKGFDIPSYSIDQILKKGKELSLKHISASEHLDEYMKFGGVLYSGKGFSKALENSIEKTIVVDLAALREINIKYEHDAYRLLYHIAVSKPFEASYSSISQKLGISKSFAIRLVQDLVAAGLLKVVFPCKGKNQDIRKEPKIYMAFPFRMFFTQSPEKGSLREEFFINHTPVCCYFKGKKGEKTPDFQVDKYKIEVGGTSKSYKQKPDYIAVDSALWEEKKIPLFLFGFSY